MPRSSKLPVLNLLTGQKSGFSPRRGDSLHRFTSNLAGSTWLCKILSQSVQGWECGPKISKISTSTVVRLPWPISKIFRGYYTPNYATLVFQMWHDSLHRLRSYCWETVYRSIRLNFSMHPVGNTALDQKMNAPFLMGTTSSITMQSLGKVVQCALAVGAKTWCLYVCFFCHAPRSARCSFEGCTVQISIALPFIGRFWRGFQFFFQKGLLFLSSQFCC